MKVLLVAMGSAGDVHPLIGVGLALRGRGHEVTLITNPYFESLASRAGLNFLPLGSSFELRSAMEDPDLWHPRRGVKLMIDRLMLQYLGTLYHLILEQHVAGETVVVAPCTALGARVAQETHGVPLVTIHLQPSVLRSVHQSPVLPPMLLSDRTPRWLKKLQFWLLDSLVIDRGLGTRLNAFRAQFGLPPARSIMGAWWNSPLSVIGLFPEWFAPPQPDWPEQLVLTGFPLWDELGLEESPPGLEEFLASGDPPIVCTPGSAMLQGQAFFKTMIEACEQIGRRAIVLTRFPEQLPMELPPTVRHFSFVPLSQLLPRAAALVHHGGVGTMAQGLAAGIPQLAMPMTFDQPDNAARIMRLGVGNSVPPARFHRDEVSAALAGLLGSREVTARCRMLAARFETRRALEQTCEAIESAFGRSKNRPQGIPVDRELAG